MRRASVHSASCTSGTPARRVMDGNSAESLPCPRTPLAPRHTAAHLAERRLPFVGLCLLLLVTSRAQSEARPGSRDVTDLEHYYQTHRRRHGGPCSASDQQRVPRRLHPARCLRSTAPTHATQCDVRACGAIVRLRCQIASGGSGRREPRAFGAASQGLNASAIAGMLRASGSAPRARPRHTMVGCVNWTAAGCRASAQEVNG